MKRALNCAILPLPNEDVGRPNKHFRVRFRSTFQGREYFTWATKRGKVLRKRTLKCLFGLPTNCRPHLSNTIEYGVSTHIWAHFYTNSTNLEWYMRMCEKLAWILPLPNEDFGRSDKRWNADFRSTFQWLVAQIENSSPWKVLRKSTFHLLSNKPKSSFGRDKFNAHH